MPTIKHILRIVGWLIAATTISSQSYALSNPTLVKPAAGLAVTDTMVVLQWIGDGTAFDVYWGAINPPPLVDSGVTAREWTTGALIPETEYYWMVAAHDSIGTVKSSPVYVFYAAERTFTQEANGTVTFNIIVNGNVDGISSTAPANSFFDPDWKTWFQPNIELRIENIGDSIIHNPRLSVNGRRNWWHLDTILATETAGLVSIPEKARSVYEFFRQNRVWNSVMSSTGSRWDIESDPVKMLNGYGFNTCGTQATILKYALMRLGIPVRFRDVSNHSVMEAYYDNAFHLFDGDENGLFLKTDNTTIASIGDIAADPSLVHQTPVFGINARHVLGKTDRELSQFYTSQFQLVLNDTQPSLYTPPMSSIAYDLYPDEVLSYRWNMFDLKKPAHGPMPLPDAYFSNGRICYSPDLAANDRWRTRFRDVVNISSFSEDNIRPSLHPTIVGQPSRMTMYVSNAYRIIGSRLILQCRKTYQEDILKVLFSTDNINWRDVYTAVVIGQQTTAVVLDSLHDFVNVPTEAFWLRFDILASHSPGDAGIDSLELSSQLAMNPRSLPELETGNNSVCYSQAGNGNARVTFFWNENTTQHRPDPPTGISPVAPISGTRPVFSWTAGVDPDGDEIVAYQLQVSDRADMRWPLSGLFDRLLDGDNEPLATSWQTPYQGKFNPNQIYYWRVRCRDTAGFWSRWSPVCSFICSSPGTPQVSLQVCPDGRTVLRWAGSTIGNIPAYYKIYGSNLPGFESIDSSYTLLVGHRSPDGYTISNGLPGPPYFYDPNYWNYAAFPPTILDTTSADSMTVMDVFHPDAYANRCFYRVVAVDAWGNESGASSCCGISARPYIVADNNTLVQGSSGLVYVDSIRHDVIRSFGSYSYNNKHPGYYDEETLFYQLLSGPNWLSINSLTGYLYITHPAPEGTHQYTLKVTNIENNMSDTKILTIYITHPTNHAPVFVTAPDTITAEDSLYQYRVRASDPDSATYGDLVRYRLLVKPSWLGIDSVTGMISGTPGISDLGDTVVAVQADDGKGGSTLQQYLLRVIHINHVPTIVSDSLTTAREDSIYSYIVVASDPDSVLGEGLVYRLAVRPSWLIIDSLSGAIMGVPGAVDVGDTVVTVVVVDGHGGVASQSWPLTVAHTNHLPIFITMPDTFTAEDSAYVYAAHAGDPDSATYGDVVRYRLEMNPSWLNIDSVSGMLGGTPGIVNSGDTVVMVAADDRKGGVAIQKYTLQVRHTNHVPVISSLPMFFAHEDSLFQYQIIASDPDTVVGDTLIYRVSVQPSWLVIDSLCGVITGVPGAANVGDTLVTVAVDDRHGGVASQSWPLAVAHTNHPPVISTIPDTVVNEENQYVYLAYAGDPDSTRYGDVVRYRLIVQPSWLSIDSMTGMISGTPGIANSGDTVVTVDAYDNKGGRCQQTYGLVVNHMNHVPTVMSQPKYVAKEDTAYQYQVIANDPDTVLGEGLVYRLLVKPSWLTIDSLNGAVTGVPGSVNVGDTVVTVAVDDRHGGVASQNWPLMVAHTNHLPTMVALVSPTSADTISRNEAQCTIEFVWHKSTDIDTNDSLRYNFHLTGKDIDTLIAGLNDTVLMYGFANSSASTERYRWCVSVFDGVTTTNAQDTFTLHVAGYIALPTAYLLKQNYPNPFMDNTNISFELPERSSVSVKIYNALGQKVTDLGINVYPAGKVTMNWRPVRLTHGMYFLAFHAQSLGNQKTTYRSVKKILVIR